MSKERKRTAGFAEDADGKRNLSASSAQSAVTSQTPLRRKKIAQRQEHSDAALGHESQNTASTDGAKEAGELPVGWKLRTVGELAAKEPNSITDGPFGSKLKTEHYTRSGPRVIRLTNIGNGEFVDAHAHISDDHFSTLKKHRVFSGDIVIAALGEKLPRACLIPEAVGAAIVKADCIRFRPSEEHSPKFLNYALNWEGTQKRTASIVHGVGRPRLNLSEIKSILLPIAPLPEQRRIVGEIEKQFTRLEAGVAALQRVQANLKRYRAAVLKAACEGRLVPTEAELQKSEGRGQKSKARYETGAELLARILTERRQNWQGRGQYKEPAELDTTRLATLPEGWIWTTIGSCFRVAVGATPSRKEASYWGGGIPWVSSGEVRFASIVDTRETITQEGLENSSTQLNPSGSVLLGMIGEGKTRGQTAILKIDACNNQNCAAIWVSRTMIPPEYVYYWLWSQYDNTRRTSSGNNQPALNKARIEVMLLPLPPLAEQTRIVAEVERRLSVVDELEAVVSANLQRATRLRQSILQKAFAGELV